MDETLLEVAESFLARLGSEQVETSTPSTLVDLVAVCERLKGAAAACQARAAVAFDAAERAAEAERGVPARDRGRGVAAQVALATRQSPARARRFVGFSHALRELPHTYDALAAGETSEYRALLIARETAFLTLEDRLAVDGELHARAGGIAALSDREAEGRARAIGQRLDPASAVRRGSEAVRQRRVSLRPAPDGMSRLSAVLPLCDGVGVYAALGRAAEAARAVGDERARGAVMADELVGRVRAGASGSPAAGGDVEVCLVMTDAALLGSDDPAAHHEPVLVVSESGAHGTLPADTARGLVRDAAQVWVRRLYVEPGTGDLVGMDSRRRLFEGALRRFVVLRDQVCRTPWCDAPVRHVDHVRRHSAAGPTDAVNGQGLCAACNLAKELAGLRQSTAIDGSITTITPTGHVYRGHRPRAPGGRTRAPADRSLTG